MEISAIFRAREEVNKGKHVNPLIMGILNLTPDSFYDGGQHQGTANAVRHAQHMLAEGADIIDLGAISTRPGAKTLHADEEWNRLKEPLRHIRRKFPDTLISVDTFRADVAEKAIGEGADIINDISGGTMDNNMFDAVANTNVAYILMHILGTPETMQQNINYKNVTDEVRFFFKEKCQNLESKGFNKIILDPGFGFGKTIDHNYKLLDNLPELRINNYPVLTGISRKSMINKVLQTTPEEALTGTITLNTVALLRGTDILRVHDVKEAAQVRSIVNALHHAATLQI